MDGYYGNPPPAPDIRAQRPSYFYRQPERRIGFAMPEGQQPYMPAEHPWQVPDLWPEIEQDIRGILQQRQEYPVTLPEEGPERQRMLMAWQMPQALQAMEMGEYRKTQERNRQIDRAENRIAKLESHLVKLQKIEGVPPSMVSQAEKRYNKAVKDYEKLTEEESGYPLYTGEGKFEVEGMEKGPGFFQRMLKGLGAVGGTIGEKFRERATQPRQFMRRPVPSVGGMGEQPSEVAFSVQSTIGNLTEAERVLRSSVGETEADRIIAQIVSETKDPNERLRRVLQILREQAPEQSRTLRGRQAIRTMAGGR